MKMGNLKQETSFELSKDMNMRQFKADVSTIDKAPALDYVKQPQVNHSQCSEEIDIILDKRVEGKVEELNNLKKIGTPQSITLSKMANSNIEIPSYLKSIKENIQCNVIYNEIEEQLNTDQKEGYDNLKKRKHHKLRAKVSSKEIRRFGIKPEDFHDILRYQFDCASDEDLII